MNKYTNDVAKKKTARAKSGNKLIYIFLAALIILYFIIYIVPGLTGALKKTEVLEYGNMQVTDDVTAYFVRDETVFASKKAGNVNYLIEDDGLVKKGTRILLVDGVAPGDDYTDPAKGISSKLGKHLQPLDAMISPVGGIVSYYVDGNEGALTPTNMEKISFKKVNKMTGEPHNLVRTQTAKNMALYKICNHHEWYILMWVKEGSIVNYSNNKQVTVKLPNGEVKAYVKNILDDGDKWRVILRCNRDYKELGKSRAVKASVVTADYSGLFVDNQCLTTDEKKRVGVYVRGKDGSFGFKPVKSLASDGKQTMVAMSYYYDENGKRVDTVDIYDEVLKNPPKPKAKK